MADSKQDSPEVAVVGSANVDLVVPVPRHPVGGETILGGDVVRHPGGKGANQAVAAARAGGVRTTFIGALGRDASGDLIAGSLRAAGVDVSLVDRVDTPTGTALIAVSPTGENTIIVAPGANRHVGIGRAQARRIAAAAVLLAQLEVPLEVIRQAVEARAADTLVVLNAAPSQDLPKWLWGALDVLVVNEHEAADLAGTGGAPAVLAEALLRRVPAVVVTLGGEGSLVATREGGQVMVGAFSVDVVDTTGAGDTYCGVLAAELAKGRDLVEAAQVAAAAGALATTAAGAQEAVPTAADVTGLVSAR
ncbi:PfkB family carbohydrate kinase [Georgenia satyanarayanai]|uniref:PfkB family carbohydrate kinase n=1 Tax=Georgenia satyanarayanai TaxID=860221 RepID=UPI00203BEE55|nr:PfkB family carbohydrate kinase [Georgenia satyanarayanai]MCM3659769.1 PfkB family carbohydrate kinase [Georgenia satyanarayanai]